MFENKENKMGNNNQILKKYPLPKSFSEKAWIYFITKSLQNKDKIISEIENRTFDKACTKDDLMAIIKETKTRNELIKELKSYFEI
jgi:hypothetical protein